jgi:ABC-2 type transport system ATP-binding protein
VSEDTTPAGQQTALPDPDSGDIVVVTGLVKRFGDLAAVDGVTFSIHEGEIFGLLGPNGAGKTTTISVISGLIEPSEGEVLVDGASVRVAPGKVKAALGVVPQEIALYPTLTALENLRFWGRMYGLTGALLEERVAEALEVAGLADRAKERIETYSGGMKRRINIAAGIMHHPKVLIMDEPTVGIDPQSRNHILETVKELNRRGMTLVYTSHYMEEVEFLCDRVGIIDQGKLIALGTIDELKRLVGDETVIAIAASDVTDATAASLQAVPGVAGVSHDAEAGTLDVLAADSSAVLAPVIDTINDAGGRISAIEIREPNLESVFLHLTGRALRD